MKLRATQCLCLAAAVCLNSIGLFATKANPSTIEDKPATAASEMELPRFQSQPKASPTPSVTEVKTARGKLGRKNRDSTESLTFTEIDLSKYESGAVYADLKVSGGGCNAALVTGSVPTQDLKQLHEYTRAGSGENSTAQLFSINAGYVSFKGQRVRSFHVSGLLIPIGMAAWYAQDCAGSYEIRVYIKNAKLSSASSRKTAPPCGDPDIQVEYDKRSPNYHKYLYERQICVRDNRNCNLKSVFSMMISQVRFVTPRMMEYSPVKDCMEIEASLLIDSKVRIVINSNNLSVSNYTLKGRHNFHPGMVTRTIREKNGGINVITSGEGTGSSKGFNEWVAKGTWEAADDRLKTAVRQQINKPIPK